MNRLNDYLIDRAKQRTDAPFSGLDGRFAIQDGCMVESMGPIVDRSEEHLGTRRSRRCGSSCSMRSVASRRGGNPLGVAWDVEENDFSDLYLLSAVVPAGRDFKAAVPDLTTHVLAR